MRILYLTESMQWSGGAEQALMAACALRDRGHELVMGCQPGSDILQRAQSVGLETEPLLMRQDYDVPAAYRIAQAVRRRKMQILHAQHPTAHALALLATFWAPAPALVVTRRVMFRIRRNFFSRFKYRSSRIRGYVAVCEAVRQELVKAGILPERIEVIPSAVTARVLPREEGKRLRQEFALPEDQPLIGMVANYAPFKGQDYFVRAAAAVAQQFPQARFLIAGRDTEKLEELVRKLGLKEAVRLAGFRRDVPRILAALDIFVMPSLQEEAATALREAMGAGLPGIGPRVGGIPEAITDGETGLLVESANVSALTAAIVRMLKDPSWARGVAERGRTSVKERFSVDRSATQMESFYARLLNGIGAS